MNKDFDPVTEVTMKSEVFGQGELHKLSDQQAKVDSCIKHATFGQSLLWGVFYFFRENNHCLLKDSCWYI